MNCDGFAADTYSFYVLGTLDPREREEVDAHLSQQCGRCRDELSLSRRVWVGVATAAPLFAPSAALRLRVIQSVDGGKPAPRVWAWWQVIPTAAALALAVVALVEWRALYTVPPAVVQIAPPSGLNSQALSEVVDENRALRQRLENGFPPTPPAKVVPSANSSAAIAELNQQSTQAQQRVFVLEQETARQQAALASVQAKLDEAEKRYQALASQPPPTPDTGETQRLLAIAQARTKQLERDLAEYRALLVTARQRLTPVKYQALLADPNLRLIRLRATTAAGNLQGHALVASGNQVMFYASQLPALPAGRTYQLWLIRGAAPAIVSAGVFRPDNGNKAAIQFEGASLTSGITAIAVTDEPETGSALPTGHKWLVGS